jgi:thiosulfate/3-mercaptopyruvate sulfurtransferase
MTSPIVTTEWLAARLDDSSVKIVEVSAKNEEAEYHNGHIPGAIRFHWKDLCWHATDRQMVAPDQLAERLGGVGISDSDTLVLYGDPVQYGTYGFWALTMAGHTDLKLLDGSRAKWTAENHPMTKKVPQTASVTYTPHQGETSMRFGRDEIRDNLGKAGRLVLDVRSPEEYSGERVMSYGQFDHGAERGGHIPGAAHLFFGEFFNDDDTFKSADEVRGAFSASGINPESFEEIVCYCRLSHRATLAWTAMTHVLGYTGAKIYDGSWTEWGSIVGFPVEK